MTSLAAHVGAMARNNAWANHRLLNACVQLSDEGYRAPRVSFFRSIELTLNHILAVDWYDLDAFDNDGQRWHEPHALRGVACESFAALRREQAAADRRLRPARARRRHLRRSVPKRQRSAPGANSTVVMSGRIAPDLVAGNR
jgi:uncharacterized damage-inducible protein DinB